MNKWDWTLREWRDYYEKLRHRNENNYQETGESRYDREAHKYDVIVDAMNKALEYDDERDAERMRRIHNINAYVDRLSAKDVFTRADVERIMNDLKNF